MVCKGRRGDDCISQALMLQWANLKLLLQQTKTRRRLQRKDLDVIDYMHHSDLCDWKHELRQGETYEASNVSNINEDNPV